MTKITEEVYDFFKKKIATLLCDKPSDAIMRCLDGWMILNDFPTILERLRNDGDAQKRDVTPANFNKVLE